MLKKTIRVSARDTLREVIDKFWKKTLVPRRQEIKLIEKIERLHAEWKLRNKSANRVNNEEKV